MINLNVLLHGDLEDVDSIIDANELTNHELRAVLQNIIGEVVRLRAEVDTLEKGTGDNW